MSKLSTASIVCFAALCVFKPWFALGLVSLAVVVWFIFGCILILSENIKGKQDEQEDRLYDERQAIRQATRRPSSRQEHHVEEHG